MKKALFSILLVFFVSACVSDDKTGGGEASFIDSDTKISDSEDLGGSSDDGENSPATAQTTPIRKRKTTVTTIPTRTKLN